VSKLDLPIPLLLPYSINVAKNILFGAKSISTRIPLLLPKCTNVAKNVSFGAKITTIVAKKIHP
jgi:hypothetical protein